MNKDETLSLLLAYLGEILYHDAMFAELANILASTGIEKRFFKQLAIKLKYLHEFGIMANDPSSFENIGSGLFSMRFPCKEYNIRILYSFLPNGQPVLLSAFYRRAGKGKTDYAPQIQPALLRMKNFKEDYCAY